MWCIPFRFGKCGQTGAWHGIAGEEFLKDSEADGGDNNDDMLAGKQAGSKDAKKPGNFEKKPDQSNFLNLHLSITAINSHKEVLLPMTLRKNI